MKFDVETLDAVAKIMERYAILHLEIEDDDFELEIDREPYCMMPPAGQAVEQECDEDDEEECEAEEEDAEEESPGAPTPEAPTPETPAPEPPAAEPPAPECAACEPPAEAPAVEGATAEICAALEGASPSAEVDIR